MRTTSYMAMAVSFLAFAVLFAFAAGPVMAASEEETMKQLPGATGEIKAAPKAETSPEIKEGEKREIKPKTTAEPKAEMKGEARPGVAVEPKAEMKGEARPGVAVDPKAEMKGEARPGAAVEPKAEMKREKRGEIPAQPKVGATGEIRGQVPAETRTGVTERAPVRMERERGVAAQTETSGRVKGGEAVVIAVDRAEECLRIRSGPSASSDKIACVKMGETLRLTGVFSDDGRWAQLDDDGWVFLGQLRTEVQPARSMISRQSRESFDEWGEPAGAGGYFRESYEGWDRPAGEGKHFKKGHKHHGTYGCGYGSYDGGPSYSYYGYWPGYSQGYRSGYYGTSFGYGGFGFWR